MKFYEIDQAIRELVENAVDPETGEVILDEAALAELQLARDQKIEGAALMVKELEAEAAAIRNEEIALAKRRKVKENQKDRIKAFLLSALDGGKLETARVKVSCRTGAEKPKVLDEDGFVMWALDADRDELLRYKTPEIDKKKVLQALKLGEELPGVELVREQSVVIK